MAIRVLLVDDSPTARTLLEEVLTHDPDFAIVGRGKDGVEAVELTARLQPSIVVIDIHMPRLDGIAATRRIMRESPTPIVVVSAADNMDDVKLALEATRAGALSACRKPGAMSSPSFEAEAKRLRDMVRLMSGVKVVGHTASAEHGRSRAVVAGALQPRIIAIAASTGGPAALHRILSALPAGFGAPILVAQHIAAGFVNGLVSWLDAASPLRVKVAELGELLEPGTVYFAPDERHLGSAGARVIVSDAPPVARFRPSATFLFESVAMAHGADALALILTGMGDDGVAGLRAIRKRGGRILGQDEASSVVFGMPGVAAAQGLVDAVVPLDEMPATLTRLLTLGRR
jgi:two-component system, chemotaxis family, protein-glutamate methylesterase/glutaminase